MHRKKFLKTCGMACLSAITLPALLQGCISHKIISGNLVGDNMLVPLSEFDIAQSNGQAFKNYVVVQNERLLFPICVFRIGTNQYTALWMRCSHQGAALQVFGDKLQCPAHGSEFSKTGAAQLGPADEGLRSFPVTIEGTLLKISLKAI